MKYMFFLFLANFLFAQSGTCSIIQSAIVKESLVDKNDILCLSKNSDKKYTVFFTFASWCKPCRMHLPDAINLSETSNVQLYILLPDVENGERLKETIAYLEKNYPGTNRLVLKTSVYGNSLKGRNKKFVEAITPSTFEKIDDFSKYILINNKGEVLFVSNWKDFGDDWKNGRAMIERTIIPLLK